MTRMVGPDVGEAKGRIAQIVRSLRAAAVAEERNRLPFIDGDDDRLWKYPPFLDRVRERGDIEQRIIDMVTNLAEDKRVLLGANSRLVHQLGRLSSEGAAVTKDDTTHTLSITVVIDGDAFLESGEGMLDGVLEKIHREMMAKLHEAERARARSAR